ncbi:MAG: peptide MFS transporter [Verrucomicrobiaceae bacterium]|nr:peptide MFS transporter [Verrucomicrobiaceae bacterium]
MNTDARHPRGIYTLFFTEMWERMSYYGMRTLLVLFMVDQVRGGMGLTDEMAAAIYGLYTASVYLAALPGGWIGDRLLGAKRSVWWGGVVIALGHLVLGISDARAFFTGLVLIALGSGLLKSNMSTLVGQLYPEGGARRDAGFTLFYMGINVGAFAGPLLCGYLGEKIGWHWGFAAAAAGMMLGLLQFYLTKRHLAGIGERPTHEGQNYPRDVAIMLGGIGVIGFIVVLCVTGVVTVNAPWLAQRSAYVLAAVAALFFTWAFGLAGLSTAEKKRVAVIVVLFLASVIFWAGFEQIGSSFTLFAERFTLRRFFGGEIPTGWFQSVNPVLVILLAPVVAMLWARLARKNIEPSLTKKLAWAQLLLASGFVVISFGAQRALEAGTVWPTWLLTVSLLHTLGELFLSPVGLSAVTKLSPPRLTGQMMGVWFLGSSLGNLSAGLFAGEVSGEATAQMPERFLIVAAVSGSAGFLLWLSARWIQKLMPGIK